MPFLGSPPTIEYHDKNNDTYIPFLLNNCPHNHTYIYYLRKMPVLDIIEISINGKTIQTPTMKYPKFENEIIFSTLVKDEDNIIIPWIEFHKRLGITRFVIYDNTDKKSLQDTLKEFISNGEVILLRWNHPYFEGHAQPTHQNHSIYAFQTSRFIGFFDVDEYINIQRKTNVPTFFDDLIAEKSVNINEISSFKLISKFFYNPDNLEINDGKFLTIYSCGDFIKNEREKNFVIPKNVKTFSVHTVTDGSPVHLVDEKDMFFNHYVYLNKPERGKERTNHSDQSIRIHM
jgi:hypothetical protein